MSADFILSLRKAGVPVSITEHLALMGALKGGAAQYSTEDFYYLARAALVKDERYFDRFDQQFGLYFKALEPDEGMPEGAIPDEWIKALAQKYFSPEEMAEVEALGFDALMDRLKQRLEDQEGRHQGGNKWIGTGGTSPFGNSGYNPQGVRVGGQSVHKRAAKVWDRREYKGLDGDVRLGVRNLKLGLRRLRRFAREGAANQLDVPGTIRATAENAGLLDLKMTPERRNAVKVLLMLDIGGSMDPHVRDTSALFTAARSEFKRLEAFYFHNCVYDVVWKGEEEHRRTRVRTLDLLRTYGRDHRLIFVGDASMSPHEITTKGGAVDLWNEEPGRVWLERLTGHFSRAAWLNPTRQDSWGYTPSIGMISQLMGGRMYPLTLAGLDAMISELSH